MTLNLYSSGLKTNVPVFLGMSENQNVKPPYHLLILMSTVEICEVTHPAQGYEGILLSSPLSKIYLSITQLVFSSPSWNDAKLTLVP
jgi:hypothetical protein